MRLIWLIVCVVLAVWVLFSQSQETFVADGWLKEHGELTWYELPIWLTKNEVAPEPNDALTTLTFAKGSPTLVAIEHKPSGTRLVLDNEAASLVQAPNTSATNLVNTLYEMWAVIRSKKTNRYQIKSANINGESLMVDSKTCMKISLPGQIFEDWIIQAAPSSHANSFYIRTKKCNGKFYYLAADANGPGGPRVRMIPSDQKTPENSVWEFRAIAGKATPKSTPAPGNAQVDEDTNTDTQDDENMITNTPAPQVQVRTIAPVVFPANVTKPPRQAGSIVASPGRIPGAQGGPPRMTRPSGENLNFRNTVARTMAPLLSKMPVIPMTAPRPGLAVSTGILPKTLSAPAKAPAKAPAAKKSRA